MGNHACVCVCSCGFVSRYFQNGRMKALRHSLPYARTHTHVCVQFHAVCFRAQQSKTSFLLQMFRFIYVFICWKMSLVTLSKKKHPQIKKKKKKKHPQKKKKKKKKKKS